MIIRHFLLIIRYFIGVPLALLALIALAGLANVDVLRQAVGRRREHPTGCKRDEAPSVPPAENILVGQSNPVGANTEVRSL